MSASRMAHHNKGGSKNSLLKVIILGDGCIGKSCLMTRFVNNTFDDHSLHTIGVEFLSKELKLKNDLYTLQIWDTAGQERYKSLRTPFYRGSDICMLTFAIDDASSFASLPSWRKEFLHYADLTDEATFPFVVVANKVDIEKREVSEEVAREWCKNNGNLPYVETSAKDAINVELAFEMALETWSKLEADLDRQGIYHDHSVKIGRAPNSHSESCCGGN